MQNLGYLPHHTWLTLCLLCLPHHPPSVTEGPVHLSVDQKGIPYKMLTTAAHINTTCLALPFFACRIALLYSTLKTSKLFFRIVRFLSFDAPSQYLPLRRYSNTSPTSSCILNIRRSFHPSSFLKTLQHLDSLRVENAQAQAKGRTKIFGHGSKFSGKIGPPGLIFPENFVPRTKIFGGTKFP